MLFAILTWHAGFPRWWLWWCASVTWHLRSVTGLTTCTLQKHHVYCGDHQLILQFNNESLWIMHKIMKSNPQTTQSQSWLRPHSKHQYCVNFAVLDTWIQCHTLCTLLRCTFTHSVIKCIVCHVHLIFLNCHQNIFFKTSVPTELTRFVKIDFCQNH